ncbi:MAG: glycine zipper 2TM domain-containing protein, partial [Rickettsiales bacterium]|nr:glycine zipper 2TM domain-containing protein [Rickettsiales bacterium]
MISKNIKKYIAISLILSFSCLVACETKQQTGTLIGGTAGALLGSRFGKGSGRIAATGLGAVAGAFIGNSIGENMDEQDKLKMQQTSNRALELSKSGQTSNWRNPDSGNSGAITPYQAYKNRDGEYCREYSQSI